MPSYQPDTSIAGALIEFHGAANDNLSLYADEVVFSGQASGAVTIEGRNVQLDDTARIEGNLIIRSSEEAIISPNATVIGEVTQTGLEDSEFFKEHEDESDGRGFFLILSTSIFLLGLILVVFARSFVEQGITILRTQPGRSILLGLAVFFGIPLFVIAYYGYHHWNSDWSGHSFIAAIFIYSWLYNHYLRCVRLVIEQKQRTQKDWSTSTAIGSRCGLISHYRIYPISWRLANFLSITIRTWRYCSNNWTSFEWQGASSTNVILKIISNEVYFLCLPI